MRRVNKSTTSNKFGATIDLIRILSSNLFKIDGMLKVHDVKDIESKQKLIDTLEAVKKSLLPIEAKVPTTTTSTNMRPHAGSLTAVSAFRQNVIDTIKDIQNRVNTVQAGLQAKENMPNLAAWIQLIQDANKSLESSIVQHEKSTMIIRLYYSLNVNIIEAKVNPNPEGLLILNPFIEICVDSSRRNRTRTIWADDAPVWNQNFDLMIPNDTKDIIFKLWSEGKDGDDPSFVGKAELPMATLRSKTTPAAEWYPLLSRGYGHVTESSLLRCILKYKEGSSYGQGTLTVIVVEGRSLVEDGADTPSPFCKMCIIDQNQENSPNGTEKDSKKKEKDKQQKTSVAKKTENPKWEEGFIFKIKWDTNKNNKLLIELHDGKLSKGSFMGQVIIPLSSVVSDISKEAEVDSWFRLRRRASKSDDSSSSTSLPQIGQIKLEIAYREEKLLPDSYYDPLFDLLMEDHLFLINFCSSAASGSNQKKDIIKSIVGVFEIKNRSGWLLKNVTGVEVDETWDLNILFRGNSMASSCLDTFMRTVGRPVLDSALRPILRELYRSTKSCEIDPTRLPKGADLKKNLAFFLETLNQIWESILATLDKIPLTMRQVLSHLRAKVTAKWPNDVNSKYTSVTSFLFLRFFCPALMSPTSFDLVDEVPNAQVSRNLALLSKTIMNLANLVKYGAKEPSLAPVNDWLSANFSRLREFIDALVEDPENLDVHLTKPPSGLFIYSREMNLLRDFLTHKTDKINREIEITKAKMEQISTSISVTGVATSRSSSEFDPDFLLSSSPTSHLVEKAHCSDDEEEVLEDAPAVRRSGSRRGLYRRVSSKSRIADGANRKSMVITSKDNDKSFLEEYCNILSKTLIAVENLNSTLSHHPTDAIKSSLPSSSSPAIGAKPSAVPALTRGSSLENDVRNRRASSLTAFQ